MPARKKRLVRHPLIITVALILREDHREGYFEGSYYWQGTRYIGTGTSPGAAVGALLIRNPDHARFGIRLKLPNPLS